MSFKIVNTTPIPGIDFGEGLLASLDTTLVVGSWGTEEELIENAAGADAVICAGIRQPWTGPVIRTLSN